MLDADALCQAHTIMEGCDQTASLSGLLEPVPGLIQLSGLRIDFTPQKEVRENNPRLRITSFCGDPEPVRCCFWVASHPGSGLIKQAERPSRDVVPGLRCTAKPHRRLRIVGRASGAGASGCPTALLRNRNRPPFSSQGTERLAVGLSVSLKASRWLRHLARIDFTQRSEIAFARAA